MGRPRETAVEDFRQGDRMSVKPIVIVGAGLAGLCCARQLRTRGIDILVVEAEDDIGGRVRTDLVNGFRLDRGFQVLQTAYPEAQQVLDYQALDLRPFEPGALIHTRGRLVRMSDPWRRPWHAFSTVWNGIGTVADRWKLARLRRHVSQGTLDTLWSEPDSTTADYLNHELGLSADLIERFLRPWFSGVFFEKELATSSRFFKFVFRMFACGDAALPGPGMGAIAKQLANGLPTDMLRISTRVESLDGLCVRFATGETIAARGVVLAVEGPEAARLTGGLVPCPDSCATTCLYFAAEKSPVSEPILVLNGDGLGPINHLCVPSDVAAHYAPSGQALISVSVVGATAENPQELAVAVRRQLRDWFGSQVDRWSPLKSYSIRHALPGQPTHFRDSPAKPQRLAEGLYCCGDHCETASIQGAMVSGRKAAESLLSDLGISGS
ncbi:MAG: NAD(P)/FAD-dependent oxidoreductase [Planctomycetales bacterium]